MSRRILNEILYYISRLHCNFVYDPEKSSWLLSNLYRNDVKGTITETLDEDEEILGSDDDEQEDPRDYTKGKIKQEEEPELLCFSMLDCVRAQSVGW